jgi:hypothetical protein
MPNIFFVTTLVMWVGFASASCFAANDADQPKAVAPIQPLDAVAQQTRQQAALQAAMDKIQAEQTKVTVMALAVRAARDSAVASRL